jgi:amidohydrolase
MAASMSAPSYANEIEALVPELRAIRHDIHQHPELGFQEHRTHGIVDTWLRKHGWEPRVCATTGLVADLFPERVGSARSIALRADLDCLPMPETTDLPYRSVHEGRAHKCGHDGHTAILMGVAALLARHKSRFTGNVRLLFQPAEEGVRGGGAKVMVAEGALEDVAEVYGLHNWPPMPKGTVSVKPGPMMAQTHTIEIEVEGVGGHASEPQRCRDPIVAGAHLVVALQTVVSRGLGYAGGAVVSIGRFHAGTTDNVIPGRALLSGTVRTFDPEVDKRVLERIREVVAGVAGMFGVSVALEISDGYPVLVNDAGCVDAVRRVGAELLGAEAIHDEGLPIAGAEDFAYFARERPSAYFLLGAGRPGGSPTCHHPDFDFDDELLPTGMGMFLGLVHDRLG